METIGSGQAEHLVAFLRDALSLEESCSGVLSARYLKPDRDARGHEFDAQPNSQWKFGGVLPVFVSGRVVGGLVSARQSLCSIPAILALSLTVQLGGHQVVTKV